MTGAAEAVEVGKYVLGPRNVARRAFDLHAVRFESHVDVKALFQDLQVLVTGSEEFLNVGNDFDGFLHSACAVSCGMPYAPVQPLAHPGNIGIVGGWKSRVAGPGRGSTTIGLSIPLLNQQVNRLLW